MGGKRNGPSFWELVHRAGSQQEEERPLLPPSPWSRPIAVTLGVGMAVFAVGAAIVSGSPAPLLFLLFAPLVATDTISGRPDRGPGPRRRPGAAPLAQWARRARREVPDARGR